MTRRAVTGTVYLLHFDRRYAHAGHYMGWTENLPGRLAAHQAGRGARLLEVVAAAGITWTLARTWPGTRALERQLKNRGGHTRLCPLCPAQGCSAPAHAAGTTPAAPATSAARRPATPAPTPAPTGRKHRT